AQVRVQQTLQDLRRLQRARPTQPHQVWVGLGHNATGAELTTFSPSRITVSVGTTVRFVNHDQTDVHTVTFGPARYTGSIEKNFIAPHGKAIVVAGLGALPSEPPSSHGPVAYDGRN